MKTKEDIFQERERNASKIWQDVYSEVFPTMTPPSYPNAWTRSAMLRFADQEKQALKEKLKEKVKASELSGLSKATVYTLITQL